MSKQNADADADATVTPSCGAISNAAAAAPAAAPQKHLVSCVDQGNSTTRAATAAAAAAILVNVAVRMEKMKQVESNLVVVEGVIQRAEAAASALKIGKSCLVHIRKPNDVQQFLTRTVGITCVIETKKKQETTRWMELSADEQCFVVFQVDITTRAVERNRKGTMLLECYEVLNIVKKEEALNDIDWNEVDDIIHNSGDSTSLAMDNKSERHRLFASWLIETYGLRLLCSGTGVLDVAGGNGELSVALLDEGVRAVVLLDPKPRLCERARRLEKQGRLKIIARALYQDGSHLTNWEDTAADALRHCSIVVGIHPDQATEPIVDLARRLSTPFAVLPCCVMPSLFPYRRQMSNMSMPVRSYRTFCQYLLDKAPEGSHYYEAHLAFVGRNKIIYSLLPE